MKEIIISGVIGWDVTAKDIREQLPLGTEKITLLINSPGGDVFECFEIYNLLFNEYKGKVTARVTGLAASAAADLFFGADERQWYNHSAIMQHCAWSIVWGNAAELRKEADILSDLDSIRIKDYCKVTGKSYNTAKKEFDEDIWLIGNKAITDCGITGECLDSEEEDNVGKITEALAREKVCQAILKTVEKKGQFMERRAAFLSKTGIAAQAVNITNTEENMENPKVEKPAAAQCDCVAAVKAERERLLGILGAAGVQYTADVKAAIEGGYTPEKYALEALTKIRTEQAKLAQGNNINPGTVAQTPGEQAGVNTVSQSGLSIDDLSTFAKASRGR